MLRVIVAAFVLLVSVAPAWAEKSVHVKAYTRKDGTHVSAHDRSPPRSKSSASSLIQSFLPKNDPPAKKKAKDKPKATKGIWRDDRDEDDKYGKADVEKDDGDIDVPTRWPYGGLKVGSTNPVIDEPFREWSDSTGAFHVIAKLRSCIDGIAKIERKDSGRIIEISLDRLSTDDQTYVRLLMRR